MREMGCWVMRKDRKVTGLRRYKEINGLRCGLRCNGLELSGVNWERIKEKRSWV